MSIRIYNQTFRDFTQLQKYTKNLVNNIIGCNAYITKEDEYFNFFNVLIQRHPYYNDIKGDGIKAFKTYRGFNNCVTMYAVRLDNTENIFSWTKLSKRNPKKDTYKTDLMNALRYSIYSQIRMYRIMNDCSKCVFCGATEDIQIDHCGEYEFKDICDMYLKNNNRVPKKLDRCPKTNIKRFHKKDYEFKTKFQIFHAEKATFQTLCKKCNLEKNFKRLHKEKIIKNEKPYIVSFD